MPSQLDLDQGGTYRKWVRAYLGPSVGWVYMPSLNNINIIAAGTYLLDLSTDDVRVRVAGSVTVMLPTSNIPSVPAVVIPGGYLADVITIMDVGGFASSFPITIKPVSVAETISGLTQVQITANFGTMSFTPSTGVGWLVRP